MRRRFAAPMLVASLALVPPISVEDLIDRLIGEITQQVPEPDDPVETTTTLAPETTTTAAPPPTTAPTIPPTTTTDAPVTTTTRSVTTTTRRVTPTTSPPTSPTNPPAPPSPSAPSSPPATTGTVGQSPTTQVGGRFTFGFGRLGSASVTRPRVPRTATTRPPTTVATDVAASEAPAPTETTAAAAETVTETTVSDAERTGDSQEQIALRRPTPTDEGASVLRLMIQIMLAIGVLGLVGALIARASNR